MCLLLLLIRAKGATWLLEQPASSLMTRHNRFSHNAIAGSIYTTYTWMGCFGAPTRKATQLWSSAEWVVNLKRSMTKDIAMTKDSNKVVHVTEDPADGRRRISGGQNLKATQEYPEEYGKEVASQYDAARKLQDEEVIAESSESDYELGPTMVDAWDDAKLEGVAEILGCSTAVMPAGF